MYGHPGGGEGGLRRGREKLPKGGRICSLRETPREPLSGAGKREGMLIRRTTEKGRQFIQKRDQDEAAILYPERVIRVKRIRSQFSRKKQVVPKGERGCRRRGKERF